MEAKASGNYRILILEDEVIISDTIARHLERHGHRVAGKAMSYQEGTELVRWGNVDLAILDIRVGGKPDGVDFAHYLRQLPEPVPFIFLTSQIDAMSVERVRETYPSGYLSKPVQVGSLLTTVEVAVHNFRAQRETVQPTVTLRDGKETYLIDLADIEYLKANHVYVEVNLRAQPALMLRSTLSELISQIGEGYLLQTHRSYAVNPLHITRYHREQVWVGKECIPISRSRRQEVNKRLGPGSQHRPGEGST